MGEFDMYRQAGTRPNFTDIARRYGMHRHTVAKYWKAGGQVEDARRCRPERAALPQGGHRGQGAAARRDQARRLRVPGRPLLRRRGAAGLQHAHQVDAAQRHRVRAPGGGPGPHPRFETAPGEQMQFDWKESLRMADADGEVFEFNVFSATLGYSRLHRFVYSRTRTEDDVMACLLAVMAANGAPRARWSPTTCPPSSRPRPGAARLGALRQVRRRGGLRARAGAAEEPADQGQVESSNRFLSRLAVYEGDFRGGGGLAAAIARIEARCNTEPSASTGVPPAVLFMRERRSCARWATWGSWSRWWPTSPSVRAPTMLVRCRGREFSVPRRCIGRRVKVLAMPSGQVRGRDGRRDRGRPRPGGREGPSSDPAHYAEALAAKAATPTPTSRRRPRQPELLGRLGEGSL